MLLFMQVSILTVCAQSVRKLETNPSFKGISIGMPISSIVDKLTYERTVNGFTLYTTTNSYYVRVAVKNGKVHTVEAIRMVKATEDNPTIFNADELETIKAGLVSQYGEPTHGLRNDTSQYSRFGFQWQAESKQVCCFMDFYGTFEGYKLKYSLSEFSLDY